MKIRKAKLKDAKGIVEAHYDAIGVRPRSWTGV